MPGRLLADQKGKESRKFSRNSSQIPGFSSMIFVNSSCSVFYIIEQLLDEMQVGYRQKGIRLQKSILQPYLKMYFFVSAGDSLQSVGE